MKRLLLAFLLTLTPSLALADTWFVQVYTTPNKPVEIYDDAEVGRIEVSLDGKFVACAQAFYFKNWNSFELAPISIGFIVIGDKDKLKFQSYGEVKRLLKLNTTITKVAE